MVAFTMIRRLSACPAFKTVIELPFASTQVSPNGYSRYWRVLSHWTPDSLTRNRSSLTGHCNGYPCRQADVRPVYWTQVRAFDRLSFVPPCLVRISSGRLGTNTLHEKGIREREYAMSFIHSFVVCVGRFKFESAHDDQ